MSKPDPVRTIDLSYNAFDSDASARSLIYALNPEWKTSPGEIDFERFKDGITNTLFKAVKKRPGYNQRQLDQEAILLRAYGNGTEVLIDREREARSHSILARHKLAPALRARFNNGLLYSFIEGSPCTPGDLRRSDVWPATARRLGQWHATLPVAEAVAGTRQEDHQYVHLNKLLPGQPIPNVWTVLQRWIRALPRSTEQETQRRQMLQEELESSVKLLGGVSKLSNDQFVLSHTDLLSGNVIVLPKARDDQEQEVSFIDYEYTTPAPQAFDLANHFAEWIGFDCDMNNIPTRAERRAFVDRYVASFREHQARRSNGLVNGENARHDADVDALMDEVDLFRGMPGLYWGTWAIIQSMISRIDFDYTSYAETRLGEYWAWKAEMNGSRKRDGKEMPLREHRWAQEK
ncbi:MAG: hypothetical protein Q9162_006345 [Coniocarpon cinnabarinum]